MYKFIIIYLFFLMYLLPVDADSSNKAGNSKFSKDKDIVDEVKN